MSNEKDCEAFLDQAQALADLKFTYIVSCQVYGAQKKSSNHRDQVCYNNILKLMLMYDENTRVRLNISTAFFF